MLISIDPENVKNIALNAQRANADIDGAMQLLNQISAHNDWNCKERKQINEYTVQNKNKIHALKENSDDFLNAVQKTAQDFQDAEKNLSSIFESVEDAIKSVLCINLPGANVAKETVKAIEKISKIHFDGGDIPNAAEILKIAKKTIPVVRYSDIVLTSINGKTGGSGK